MVPSFTQQVKTWSWLHQDVQLHVEVEWCSCQFLNDLLLLEDSRVDDTI
jgi:hypothetical protein